VKYGAHSLMLTPAVTEETLGIFDHVQSLGLDGIEIHLGDVSAMPVKAIERKKQETGLDTTFGTMLDAEHNIISPDPSVRRAGVEFLKERVDLIASLGGTKLCGVVYAAYDYFTGNMATAEEWKRSVDGLQQVAEHCRARGVVLGVEPINRYKTYFLNTVADARRLVDDVGHPNVGLLLDTYHMNIEEQNFYEAFKTAGDKLVHVHLNENYRGIPGTGLVVWRDVFRALDEIGYDGWGVMESFVPEVPEVASLTTTWRMVAPSVDAILEGGLRFFREFRETAHRVTV
jgi:D-psicose/D-tagatose/L-ribulose 3-epimerase